MQRNLTTLLCAAILSAVAWAGGSSALSAPQPNSDGPVMVQAGRAAFVAQGCYQCHGFAGQGGEAGPSLVTMTISDAALAHYVRRPSGVMPAFSEKLLPQAKLEMIITFIRTLEPGRPPRSIKLLAGFVTNPPSTVKRPADVNRSARNDMEHPTSTADGKSIYAANCAACHGEKLAGGSGPSLLQQGATRTVGEIASLIKAPPPQMPKLYPSPLASKDVEAVAVFVHGAVAATN